MRNIENEKLFNRNENNIKLIAIEKIN